MSSRKSPENILPSRDTGLSFFENANPQSSIRGARGTYRLISKVTSRGKYGVPFIVEGESGKQYFVKMMDAEQLHGNQFLHRHLSRSQFTPSYSAEYEILRGAKSKNQNLSIPLVHDVGACIVEFQDSEVIAPFIVYEKLNGFDLTTGSESEIEFLKSELLSIANFPNAIRELIQTLRHLHALGVLHGDIHPGNIMCVRTPNEEIVSFKLYLVDFGQAFVLDSFYAQTLHDKSSDHPYTAPERLRRIENPSNLATPTWQAQADIFSLGCTIFSIMTGMAPPKAIRTIVNDRTKIIDEHLERHSEGLLKEFNGVQQIIAKATEPNLQRRYLTVADMLADWETYICGIISDLPTSEEVKHALTTHKKLEGNPLRYLAGEDFKQLLLKSEQLASSGEYVQQGTRNEVIRKLCVLVETAELNDIILEYTGTYAWHSHNLGVNGRYHSSLHRANERGVKIFRLCDVAQNMGDRSGWDSVLELALGMERIQVTEQEYGWKSDNVFCPHGLAILRVSAPQDSLELNFQLAEHENGNSILSEKGLVQDIETKPHEEPSLLQISGFRARSLKRSVDLHQSEFKRVFSGVIEEFSDSYPFLG